MTNIKAIKIPVELLNRLKARKRPHQAIAGVIEELLNEVKNHKNTLVTESKEKVK